jgi:1-acyl-sn-glycerol-3-phosphate acyltransferase
MFTNRTRIYLSFISFIISIIFFLTGDYYRAIIFLLLILFQLYFYYRNSSVWLVFLPIKKNEF